MNEALAQGPRAQGLGPLGPGAWGTRPQFCFETILVLPCVLAGVLSYVQGSCLMCRGQVLCAGAKSYVQGSSLICRVKSYVQGQSLMYRGKVFCVGAKSYVKGQSLVTLFFYGVIALWRERPMA